MPNQSTGKIIPSVTIDIWWKVLNKWFGVWAHGNPERGRTDCEFCQIFICRTSHPPFATSRCEGCPIKRKTGLKDCAGTPYSKWDNHIGNARYLIDPQESLPCGCYLSRRTEPEKNSYCKEAIGLAFEEWIFLLKICPYENLVSESVNKWLTSISNQKEEKRNG